MFMRGYNKLVCVCVWNRKAGKKKIKKIDKERITKQRRLDGM